MTGFEPLIGAATAGLAGLISSLVQEQGSQTLRRFDFDIGKNIAFKNALVEYVRRYIDRHGTLKVVCVRMDNPVKLDEIYTAVQLLDRRALGYYDSTESLEELFRQSGRRSFNLTDAKKKEGIQVANEQQYLMVLGGPGVGKSTFLRKVGLEALRTLGRAKFAQRDPANLLVPQDVFYQHPCIPVMLELRLFNQPEVSIQAKIAEELRTCGFPHAEELTELLLKNGKLLVVLDGLDEVPSATLNHVITEIENLVDRYSDNRFIASCRVAAYNFSGFKRFKDVAMAAFEDDQIERFIQNWFRKPQDAEADTATKCWELLSSKDYEAAKELAQTPLLLTLLCVVYDEYQDFPKKRHALYGEALDVLLRKWASEKRIQRDPIYPIYQELSTELELDLLSEIAYTSFVDNQLFFTKEVVVEQIREFLVQNLNAPSHLDAEQVLKEIEIQQGILVERARDTYSFSHLTFQEYLTAKCIVDNHKIDQLVRDHATDDHWREVFLLVVGLSPGRQGADRLLLTMEQQAQTYLNSDKLIALVTWSEMATHNSPGNSSHAAKRIAAVFLALDFARARALARDFALALDRALDHVLARALDFARARALDFACAKFYRDLGLFHEVDMNQWVTSLENLKFETQNQDKTKKSLSAVNYEIVLSFFKNFNLDPKFVQISEQDIQQLNNYFYILELMVCCKEAAVRVSPQVWQGIESRMLTVPKEYGG